MKRLLAIGVVICTLRGSVAAAVEMKTGPLPDYVAKPDASYRWVKKHAGTVLTASYAELILTSQTWRNIVWKHQLFLIKPAALQPDTKQALLYITGGNWNDRLEKAAARRQTRPMRPACWPRWPSV